MKYFVLLLMLLAPFFNDAQTDKAPLKVLVMDKSRKAIPNDKITFIGQKSGIEVVGITDARGQFMVHLPAGDEYGIKVEVIGAEIDYNTFEVPTPPPGAVFNTVTLEIMYEIPTSVVLKDLKFDSGKFNIKPECYATLDNLVEYLLRKKNINIRVEGHTDHLGDDEPNLKLSDSRAKAVKKYLVDKGIDAARIEAIGLGEVKPIADNSTVEGRAENRRTEIHIVE